MSLNLRRSYCHACSVYLGPDINLNLPSFANNTLYD